MLVTRVGLLTKCKTSRLTPHHHSDTVYILSDKFCKYYAKVWCAGEPGAGASGGRGAALVPQRVGAAHDAAHQSQSPARLPQDRHPPGELPHTATPAFRGRREECARCTQLDQAYDYLETQTKQDLERRNWKPVFIGPKTPATVIFFSQTRSCFITLYKI